MLLNSLYTINDVSDSKNHPISATIIINVEHAIFKGHFPGRPVVPGVCLVKMICDAISIVKASTYFMRSSSFVKFINPVDPTLLQELTVQLTILTEDENGLNVDAVLSSNEIVYLKLKARFETLKNN